MFNGQNFLNGSAPGPFAQPGQAAMPTNGLGLSAQQGLSGINYAGAGMIPGSTASNPLQALMQQQQLQQMRWQQTQQAQGQQSTPQQQNISPQQQQLQSQQDPQQRTTAPQQQFFNPSAFLQQATAGNAMLSRPGPSSGIQAPDGSQLQQQLPNTAMQTPAGINPALMANMGSLNPQQLQALLAASQNRGDGSLNPSALLGANTGPFGTATMPGGPATITSTPGSVADPTAMLQQMQNMGGIGGPSPHMGANPFLQMDPNLGLNPGSNGMPGSSPTHMQQANGVPGPSIPQQQQQQQQQQQPPPTRPSTAKSATSQADGPGTPDVKGTGPARGGKGGHGNRKQRPSVKPEATPTPTMSAASIPGAVSSPRNLPRDNMHHRSPSVSGSRPPAATFPGQQPPTEIPQNWRPHLSVQQQQEVMTRAMDYAQSHQMNPAEVLGRMNLLYVKADLLPGGGNGCAMPNGAAVLNFDEARLLGLPRPGHPGASHSGAAGAAANTGPFPQSPAGAGFPMGQPQANNGGMRPRQPSAAARPDLRQGFPAGSMGPPPMAPGQPGRHPAGSTDNDARQPSTDAASPFPPGVDPSAHLRRISGVPGAQGPMLHGSMQGPPGTPNSALPFSGHPGAPFGRLPPNLPPVHGGALPPATKQGRPVTGMNTRFTPLPNFDRPSLTEEDLSGNSWKPLDDKEEQRLLDIMQIDADYEETIKSHAQQMLATIRGRVEQMRPLKRRDKNGNLVAPEHLHWWERADDEEPIQIDKEGRFRLILPDQRKAILREKRGGRMATTGQQFEQFRKKQLAVLAEQVEDLVPIRLEIDHEGWKLRDTFTWNASDELMSYDEFARNLCEDFGLPEYSFVPLIRESISLQIREHLQSKMLMAREESAKVSGCGILSEEDEMWWRKWREAIAAFEEAAWAGQEKPSLPVVEEGALSIAELRKVVSTAHAPASLRIQIKLDITVGAMNLLDQFDWDILDDSSNPEVFAACFATDLGLAGEFKTAIAHSIREQVDVHLRSLVLVGHPFDGSAVTDEEMRGAFLPEYSELSSLKRSGQDIEDCTPNLVRLSEAEVDRQERDRERESKRKRRQTRGRRGVNMPDRDPLKTQRTPAICGLQASQIEAAGGAATVAAAAGATSTMAGDIPGVRTSTRRAAAAANASFHAQSEFDTPTPAPEPRPSAAPPSAKRRRLEDYSVHYKYPGGLGREDSSGPRFAPSSEHTDAKPRSLVAASMIKVTDEHGSAPQLSSPNKESRTASTSSASTPKVGRPEDVANQHPNIFEGQWYCSNCGVPGWLTPGRRKGPLGEKTLCGSCGKFWHRFRRMKQVEYTRDEAFHRAHGSGGSGLHANGLLPDDDSSSMPTGENTPNAETHGRSPASINNATVRKIGANRYDDQSSTRGTTPDLPFQRVGSPSDSDSDHSQSPRASRRPSPRKASAGFKGGEDGHTSSRGRKVSPDKPDSLPSFKRRNSVLAAQAAVASSSPAPSAPAVPRDGRSSSPHATMNVTSASKPTPPDWLKGCAETLRTRYPHDRFELRPKGAGEWRIRCLDCPGKLYNPGPGESLTNFEIHLKNRAHRANVASRLEKGGEENELGAVITAASPV